MVLPERITTFWIARGRNMSEPQTEIIDKLFLELSQFTKAKTAREIQAEESSRSRPLTINERSLLIEALDRRIESSGSKSHQEELGIILEEVLNDRISIRNPK